MPSESHVLALDLGSGGAVAALMGSDLEPVSAAETPWSFVTDADGAAGLSASNVVDSVASAVRHAVVNRQPPEAIVLSSMMHTLLILGPGDTPRSPIVTWNDRRHLAPVERIAERFGDYRKRTGCHLHPSFPAMKIAWLRARKPEVLDGDFRITSLRGWIGLVLTGNWTEDVSTASSSGLLELESGTWDAPTLDALELDENIHLPPIVAGHEFVGTLRARESEMLGLKEGVRVVAGGGDGFFATTGSNCNSAAEAAATLGTTVSLRRFLSRPSGGSGSGTFCYRSGPGRFLAGCAGSNGGNLLEWADRHFGSEIAESSNPPVFMPFLNGERSPFWDSTLEARWTRLDGPVSRSQLRQSVNESIAFQLAAYFELVAGETEGSPERVVLSGNAFAFANVAPVLAGLVPAQVVVPEAPGLATLRGAAVCGFEALGVDTTAGAGRIIQQGTPVSARSTKELRDRYDSFRLKYLEGAI